MCQVSEQEVLVVGKVWCFWQSGSLCAKVRCGCGRAIEVLARNQFLELWQIVQCLKNSHWNYRQIPRHPINGVQQKKEYQWVCPGCDRRIKNGRETAKRRARR